ncbi:MAG: flagellar protein [Calditrichaeota bacterium]|nr:flagellar protein [Calditrichota bacterium]MCB0270306.1 flagellar protein [Calditrichota bacterium]MCB0299583.1 flagellar protein [Calditrichota bacterium]MCB9068347.1 flagellar protein [Calditrichia bacterium]
MAGKIDGLPLPFVPIGGVNGLSQSPKPMSSPEQSPFRELLKAKLDETAELKFSAHAQSRMRSRDISLSADQLNLLNNAVDQAKEKGGHNSLVLMSDYAFIVNADNRTVVTAMDRQGMDDSVFTNIDSAVVL